MSGALWDQLLRLLPPELQQHSTALLSMLLCLALSLLLLKLSGPRSFAGGRRNTLLLTGPCNAGKTTLFLRLRDGELRHGTVASMQENAAPVTVVLPSGRSVALTALDMPGHHSFRHRLEAQLNDAAAIVFVLDAVEVTPHKTEAAEALYDVLASPAVHKHRTPVFIACNKMDLEHDAHSAGFVTKTLEKQLDAMRKTKAAGIGGGRGAAAAGLGRTDKPFSFAGLRSPVRVDGVSALSGDLHALKAFVAECGL